MSAVIAALFQDHATADRLRTRLVKDGFPTDRVELISLQDPGQARLVPADSLATQLSEHFKKLFQHETGGQSPQHLTRGILADHAAIVVQPRGDIETQRALDLLGQAGPLELRDSDFDKQSFERAASPNETTVIPGVRKILLGPGQP